MGVECGGILSSDRLQGVGGVCEAVRRRPAATRWNLSGCAAPVPSRTRPCEVRLHVPGQPLPPPTNVDAQGATLPRTWDSTSCRIVAARQKSKRILWEWRAASLALSGATGQLRQTARSSRLRKRVARAPDKGTARRQTAVRSSSSAGQWMASKEVPRTSALFCLPCLLLWLIVGRDDTVLSPLLRVCSDREMAKQVAMHFQIGGNS